MILFLYTGSSHKVVEGETFFSFSFFFSKILVDVFLCKSIFVVFCEKIEFSSLQIVPIPLVFHHSGPTKLVVD